MRITKSAEERKKEIIQAAMELFKEKGYKNTSINDIAQKINISHGLLHYHFKSKEQVLEEVVILVNENIMKKLNLDELLKSTSSAIEKINIIMSTALFSVFEQAELIKASMDVNGIEFIDGIAYRSISSIVSKLIQIIEEGNAQGLFHCNYPKETAAMAVFGLERQFRKEAEENPDVRKMILCEYLVVNKEKYLDIFMKMLGMKEPMGLLEYESIKISNE